MIIKYGITESDLEEPRPTQGGGTAVWDQLQDSYVFVTTPDWWEGCEPGDLVPDEWGIL